MSIPSTSPSRTSAPRPLAPVSFTQAVTVVARREIVQRLRSKGFVISTLVTLALLLLIAVLGPRLGELMTGGPDTIAVTATTRASLPDGYEPLEVADADAAREAVRSGEADAALIAGEPPVGITVVAQEDAPADLVGALSLAPRVELVGGGEGARTVLLYLGGLAFGLAWMMTTMMFGLSIAQSVVQEKQSRIVEILLVAISARALLAGKVIGNSILAFVQVALFAGTALLGLAINGHRLNLDGLGLPIIWFVPLFVIGFVMVAALYGAAASLVSRQEDISSATMPLSLLAMLPYFVAIGLATNATALHVASYIPFTAPVAVPLRILTGDAQVWQNVLALVSVTIGAALAIMLAARVYERSILKTGKALSWKDALTG